MAGLQARTDLGFCSMKRLRVFLLPHEWDASPSQGTLSNSPVPIYTLGWRGALSCLRTQHNVPGQGSNITARSGVERTNLEATAPPVLTYKLCCFDAPRRALD